MIEDEELREIFKIESSEHIQQLEKGFLSLERDPQNVAILEEVFREAHSLKGASRIIGLPGVEAVSHRLEDIFGAARKGTLHLTPEIIDLLCRGLDAIRALVREAVTGESSGVAIAKILEELTLSREQCAACPSEGKEVVPPSGANGDAPVITAPDDFIYPEIQPLFTEEKNAGTAAEVKEESFSNFRLETIRVETGRLDRLMSLSGELTVTNLRISQRIEEISDALLLWEEFARNGQASAGGSADPHKKDSAFTRLGESLMSLRNSVAADSSRLDYVNAEIDESINRIRLLPVSTLLDLFPRMVRDLAREKGKEVNLVIRGGETVVDKRIIEEMKDPLMHLVRNAVVHGIEVPLEREGKNKPRMATITVRAFQSPANVVIEVADDGRGLDNNAIKGAALKGKIVNEKELESMSTAQIQALIFASGVSTSDFISEVSGRGVGLDVVRVNVERLKGTVTVESSPGQGCLFRAKLPLTLATSRVMLVAVNSVKFALPFEQIQTTISLHRKDLFKVEGRQTIVFNERPLSVMPLSALLELKVEPPSDLRRAPLSEIVPCIILTSGEEQVGIIADELIDVQEVVLKQYSPLLKRVRNVSGATILSSGEVCMVLNPFDLMKSVRMKMSQAVVEVEEKGAEVIKCILVAEDSITVRTQMKRIIEGAGYEVVVAVDGVDAFNKLSSRTFDALVSDINMPNMNGLVLTEKVRMNRKFRDMPVILVSSLASDSDRQRGLEAGANAYIPKPSFDQKIFLETLGRLV